MPNFKHPFIDFSQGEISEKLLILSTSEDSKKSVSYMENCHTTKTKGFRSRTGTIAGRRTAVSVASDFQDVKSVPFFVSEGDSYVGLMYVTRDDEVAKASLNLEPSFAPTLGSPNYYLTMEFLKEEDDEFNLVNFFSIPLDVANADLYIGNNLITGESTYGNIPLVTSNDWRSVKDFRFDKYKNFMVFTHDTGTVEPFVVSFDGTDFEYFCYKDGLFETNPNTYPELSSSTAFSVPFSEPNLNADLAVSLELSSSTDGQTFIVRSKFYDPEVGSGEFVNWSDYSAPLGSFPTIDYVRPHPFMNFNQFLRVTIGGNSYILKYVNTNNPGNPGGLDLYVPDLSDTTDPAYNDAHVFKLILDADGAGALATVAATETITTNFQVESFNRKQGFPDNCIFHEQRLCFSRDGVNFFSNVGNAFFFNQWRFPQDDIFGIYFYQDPVGAVARSSRRDLLIDYVGTKVVSDPFEVTPLQSNFIKRTWLSSSENNLEIGTFDNVNNVSPAEDGVFGFNSIRSRVGLNEGSSQSLAERVNNFTIFIGSNNTSLRDYRYDGRTRSFISNDLNQLNDEIYKHLNEFLSEEIRDNEYSVKAISVDRDNDFINVIISPTNAMIRFRYSLSDGISSWTRVTLGVDEVADSYVPIHDVCYARSSNSSGKTVLITKRDGEFYVEHLAEEYSAGNFNASEVYGANVTIQDLPVGFDFSNRQVSGTAQRDWVLPSFYFNKTVSVLADGFLISNVAVDGSGNISLDRDFKTLVAGFSFMKDMISLPIEPTVSGSPGSSLDELKHINHVHIRLNNSYGGLISLTGADYEEKIPYDQDNMVVGVNFPLFTGYKEISPEVESDEDIRVRITSTLPYPLEVLAIVVKGEVNRG